MSGICGVFEREGRPLDPELLRRMAACMAFRGPDRQDTWSEGSVGFGHALLRTTEECVAQPLSFDGRTWITADARVDARAELRRELVSRGRAVAPGCSDAGLILHAWHAWDEACVDHLLGDFAFAIWDAPRQRLFCARDALGIRPFFHTSGARFAFGNTLDAVQRAIPGPHALDEEVIADFLLFEANRDPSRSGFAAIRRLPPGHVLIASRSGVATREYWSAARFPGIAYRDARDYVPHFRAVLGEAVQDRLRTPRVAVSMSGGVDSPALAAIAKSALAARGRPFDLQAHTIVYDRIMPDEERRYSGMAAAALGIPIHHRVADDYAIYERFDEHAALFPEPYHGPDFAAYADLMAAASRQARVLLTGYDGDALLDEPPRPYFASLLRSGRPGAFAAGWVGYAFAERGRIRDRLRAGRRRATAARGPGYPRWLDPEFEARLRLKERWREAQSPRAAAHPLRPRAHESLAHLLRHPYFFDQFDAGASRVPLECRHPLLDLRVVALCLSLPPYPWCVRKAILREAMAGELPEAVLRRPKSPLASWAGAAMLADPASRWVNEVPRHAGLARFVDTGAIPPAADGGDPFEGWMNLRPLSLARWLRRHERSLMQSDEAIPRSPHREIA
jgi:asparagine synthase (glutamine-hydrolysing)